MSHMSGLQYIRMTDQTAMGLLANREGAVEGSISIEVYTLSLTAKMCGEHRCLGEGIVVITVCHAGGE